MNSERAQYIVKNSPIPVEFGGLRGDTMTMQGHGWQISVEVFERHDYHRMHQLRFWGKHPGLGLKMVSYPYVVNIMNIVQDPRRVMYEMEPIQLHICAREVMIQMVMSRPMGVTFPVDFESPSLEAITDEAMYKTMKMEECILFKPFNDQATIYVPEKEIWTMEKHLNAIVEMQRPKQAEIREKLRKQQLRENYSYKDAEEMSLDGNGKSDVKLQLVAVS